MKHCLSCNGVLFTPESQKQFLCVCCRPSGFGTIDTVQAPTNAALQYEQNRPVDFYQDSETGHHVHLWYSTPCL